MRKFHICTRFALGTALAGLLHASDARAEPFRAQGEASVQELGKNATVEDARARAIGRAQVQALEAALEALQTEIERAAKKRVLEHADAWAGSYRVVGQEIAGGSARVDIEVDVDLARLAKRLLPRPVSRSEPLYGVPQVRTDGDCSNLQQAVKDELLALDAVRDSGGERLELKMQCTVLGPVPHTFAHAARVHVVATSGRQSVADLREEGLATSKTAAVRQAVQRAVGTLGATLSRHRAGQVEVRVESPLPAARVRRLERVIRESVLGVVDTKVVGLERDGSVVLRVVGELQADALARKLEALSFPGFSLTIVRSRGSDGLTVRLR